MRKRLRKKQGEGEFRDYAFGVSYLLDDVSAQRANEFLDRFVDLAIEPAGLECRDARHDRKWDFKVTCVDGSKPTPAQRKRVSDWLRACKEVARFEVEDPD